MAQKGTSSPQAEAPAGLEGLQKAFGRSIAVPFAFDGAAGDYEVQVDRYDPELVSKIRDGGSRSAAQRLALYNQQYWFRLLTIMQEEYPLAESLLGIHEFNQMAMAYLDAHPPCSPRLRDLSDSLVGFLRTSRWGSAPVVAAAELEWRYIQAFDAAQRPAFAAPDDEAGRAALMEQPLQFQPHVFLWSEEWPLVAARRSVKAAKSVVMADLEPRRRSWLIYRRVGIEAMELGALQAAVLGGLGAGVPFGDALESVAADLEGDDLAFLAANVRGWFTRWVSLGIFAASAPS